MGIQPNHTTDNVISAQPPSPAPLSSTDSPLPNVPDIWPGPFGVYKYSRDAVKVNLAPIVVIWLLNNFVSGIIQWKFHRPGNLLSLIVGSILGTALILLYLAGIRRQRLSFGETFSKSLPLLLKMIGLYILVALSLIASLILLIIPFFIVMPRIVLAQYYLVNKNMGIIEAYKASWASTKGYATKVWGIIGVSVLMLVLMLTIIGIPVAIYLLIMYAAAMAVLYEFINKQQPAVAIATNDSTINHPIDPTLNPPPTNIQ